MNIGITIAITGGVVVYILLISMVAWAAEERGRTVVGFSFIAIFLTPVFALLLLAAAGDRR